MHLLILFTVLSVVMFTFSCRELDSGTGPFTTARSVFSTITTPVRFVGGVLSQPFQGLGNIITNLTADQETLSELEEENDRLTAQVAELEEASQTAERLQNLLSLKSTYNLQSVAARIISGSTDSWNQTVTIDKGTSSGLAVGMPVADQNGAIGQIIECGLTSSVVRLITDENSGVSAMVQSSRAQGMLEGSANGGLTLELIRVDQTVEVGDIVVTSGLGGVFPKGLPMGTVSSVEKMSGALYYSIGVTPLSTTENYEEVLVITSLTEDQTATEADVAEADAQDGDSESSTTEGEEGSETELDEYSDEYDYSDTSGSTSSSASTHSTNQTSGQ